MSTLSHLLVIKYSRYSKKKTLSCSEYSINSQICIALKRHMLRLETFLMEAFYCNCSMCTKKIRTKEAYKSPHETFDLTVT